ncbi:hypothetical protein RUND412_008486 [Rhizina undulata]
MTSPVFVMSRCLPLRTSALNTLLKRTPVWWGTVGSSNITLHINPLRYASKKATPPSKKSVPTKKISTPTKASAPAQKSTSTTTTAKSASPASEAKYYSIEEALGGANKDILLYASHSRSFLLGCYGICFTSLGWIVYTYYTNVYNSPAGSPWYVERITYVGIVMMSVVVGITAYYPTRLIQMIRAHPIPAKRGKPPSVSITLFRRPILPLLPMKKIHIQSPKDILLDFPLQSVQPVGQRKAMEGPKSTGRKIVDAITSIPFMTFRGARNMLTTENFVPLRIDGGRAYGLDKDGWVWELRGLDRLFGVRRTKH